MFVDNFWSIGIGKKLQLQKAIHSLGADKNDTLLLNNFEKKKQFQGATILFETVKRSLRTWKIIVSALLELLLANRPKILYFIKFAYS